MYKYHFTSADFAWRNRRIQKVIEADFTDSN